MIRALIATSLLVVVVTLLGCFGADNTPEGIANHYITSGMAGDAEAMESCLSSLAKGAYERESSSQTLVEALSKSIAAFQSVESHRIDEVQDKGGYTLLSLTFTLKDQSTRSAKWPMRSNDGQWQLDELKSPR